MTAGDVPALQQLELAAGALFLDVGMPEIAGDDPPSPEDLLEAAQVLVAVDREGTPVGYARVDLVGGRPHLEQLSVPPEHGRQGIGAALLDAALAWAGEQGASELTLTTFRDVPFNAPYYERNGWTIVAPEGWSEAIRALVAHEAADGLDPDQRVVMCHPTGGGPAQ